jgi:hypothetical protein
MRSRIGGFRCPLLRWLLPPLTTRQLWLRQAPWQRFWPSSVTKPWEHGLGCIGAGGHVTLLTSLWFRCSKYAPIADAGGPIGNLVAGAAAAALLRRTGPRPAARLFLFLFAGLNLLWFTGQLAFESLSASHDDWYWILSSRPAIWRPVGAVVGIGGYVLAIRWLAAVSRRQGGPQARAIRLAYAAAAASVIISGLMWQPEPLRSAFQGFLEMGVAPLGLLRVTRTRSGDIARDAAPDSVPRSWGWIGVCAVLFGLFLFIQARGLGPMAASRLTP